MLDLPPRFVRNITNSFGQAGERFLADLPGLLRQAAQRWHLTIGEPFKLSYNYVCAAQDPDGRDVVLKIGVPGPGLVSEIEALRHYNGEGAVRLVATDAAKGMLLEERLKAGTMLSEIHDDEKATEVAAALMRELWRPVPEMIDFFHLADWFDGFKKLRKLFRGGTGPLPPKIVDYAEGTVKEFLAEQESVLLHGDFHHYNVLSAGDNWLAIDPKGVIGPRCYEVGPLLLNPLPQFILHPDSRQRTERRFAILSERLGFERKRIRGWAIAHAMLSAWWDIEDNGHGGEYAIRCAELFMSIPE